MTPFDHIVEDMISPIKPQSDVAKYDCRMYFCGNLKDDFQDEDDIGELLEVKGK